MLWSAPASATGGWFWARTAIGINESKTTKPNNHILFFMSPSSFYIVLNYLTPTADSMLLPEYSAAETAGRLFLNVYFLVSFPQAKRVGNPPLCVPPWQGGNKKGVKIPDRPE
jgi:hypothetical protein